MSWVPTRHWMASSRDRTAPVYTLLRTTLAQYDVNQAVKRGVERQKVQPASLEGLRLLADEMRLERVVFPAAASGIWYITPYASTVNFSPKVSLS
jgi:hypothetical protein